ncbi:MAG: type IX secretion system membrane protein PorP/SprF [Cytophagaceae bacterium]|nr:type IX secretion system membrane protein PorP/SprF [Cytophagaceae bacterium]
MKPLFYRLFVYFVFLLLLFGTRPGLGQKEAMYSQYMFNMMAVNPAYAGSRGALSLTGLYRQSWAGIEGAPVTQSFTADMPLRGERFGLGLSLFNDKAGKIGTTGAMLSYAFKVKLTPQGTLSLGLQAGALNYRANFADVNTGNVDPAFNQNINKFLPNFGTGIFYSTDRFCLGVSCPQLLRGRLNEYVNDTLRNARQERRFFGMAGAVFRPNDALALKPSALVKGVSEAPLAFDANLNLWINNRIGFGGSFRTSNVNFQKANDYNGRIGDAVAGLAEVQRSDQFRLG